MHILIVKFDDILSAAVSFITKGLIDFDDRSIDDRMRFMRIRERMIKFRDLSVDYSLHTEANMECPKIAIAVRNYRAVEASGLGNLNTTHEEINLCLLIDQTAYNTLEAVFCYRLPINSRK